MRLEAPRHARHEVDDGAGRVAGVGGAERPVQHVDALDLLGRDQPPARRVRRTVAEQVRQQDAVGVDQRARAVAGARGAAGEHGMVEVADVALAHIEARQVLQRILGVAGVDAALDGGCVDALGGGGNLQRQRRRPAAGDDDAFERARRRRSRRVVGGGVRRLRVGGQGRLRLRLGGGSHLQQHRSDRGSQRGRQARRGTDGASAGADTDRGAGRRRSPLASAAGACRGEPRGGRRSRGGRRRRGRNAHCGAGDGMGRAVGGHVEAS